MATKNSMATRTKLLDAARDVIRAQGYAATTVDDICTSAGVSKGSFFHHFESKDDLGVAAIEAFASMADTLFTTAPYNDLPDPRDRILGYVDMRAALIQGDVTYFSCLMGTTVQEAYATHPDLRDACDKGMTLHIKMLERDIAAAKERYAPDALWSPEGVAYFIQATLQGAFIYAKVKQSPDIAAGCLAHARAYLEMLLDAPR
ncbi:MAG TPA: TetR/AcrR family transcriptional regulator [Magnetospirillaceae bacterium]